MQFKIAYQIETFDGIIEVGTKNFTAKNEEAAHRLAFVGILHERKEEFEMDGDDDYLGNIKSISLNVEEVEDENRN